ncbi:MAG: sigma-70 family RNA polymerase sigma factor [Chloroflexales bacterium]|nr:sigma-70 family RNA polymerase sigma factor [Chloroflexales bacterium]
MITSVAPAIRPMTSVPSDPGMMDLASLARRALAESRSFYRHEEYDPRYAYELFRRALVERDDTAWGYIFEQYAPLVEHWVRRTGAFAVSGESSDFFVSAAFTRFWRAIPAARFASFPSLASLLNYLRRCATCVVIDSARSQSYTEMLPEECVNWNDQRLGHADEEATEQVSREEFWGLVDGLLTSDAERVVIRSSYLLGMKPSDIYARWGTMFHGVEEVYTIKRTVLTRLRKSPELRGLY